MHRTDPREPEAIFTLRLDRCQMTLYLRADASADIGIGHVMRCLALAEVAAERGIDTSFTGVIDEPVVERLQRGGHQVVAPNDSPWLEELGHADAVVFDGYGFTPDDHEAAGRRGARVAAVDDLGKGRYPVDLLVHPNLVEAPSFEVRPSTRVLVGPRYAFVRREFRSRRRLRDGGRRLLVTLGGSDVGGIGRQIAAWAHDHPGGWDVRLLVGPSAPDVTVPHDVEVVRAPDDVGALFDEADVAIAAAGSTTWELCCMGVPTLLVQVADNQRHVGTPVAERGAAIFLGTQPIREEDVHEGLDQMTNQAVCAAISRAAMDLVDGDGAQRVLGALVG